MPASRSVYEEAIKKAINPGGCRYLQDGKPACVIAQLYVLKGGAPEDMGSWHTDVVLSIVHEFKPPLLMDEPRLLMADLQCTWDTCHTTAEEGREIMMGVLDNFFRVTPTVG